MHRIGSPYARHLARGLDMPADFCIGGCLASTYPPSVPMRIGHANAWMRLVDFLDLAPIERVGVRNTLGKPLHALLKILAQACFSCLFG